MMKKMFKVATVLFIAVALCSLSSCVNNDVAIESNATSSGIYFTGEVNGMATRATDTAFESGDVISVTAYQADGTVYEGNVEYTYSNSLFSSSTPIKYTSGDELSFRAIYPYVTLSEDKKVSFTIESDQSIGTNYTLSDLMSGYASLTSEENPELSFEHILTKMVFKVTDADIDMTGATATVNTYTEVEYNIAQLSCETDGDVSAVKMASDGDNSFKAIVAPQSYEAGDTLGVLTIGGEEYKIVLNSALTISAGVQYSCSLTIADGTVTFNSPIVVDWMDGTVSEDEAEAEEYDFELDWDESSQYYVSSISALNSLNLSDLDAGQVVVLRDGTYSGSITLDSSGTSSKPFRVRSETPGGVILTGSSYLYFKGDYIEVSGFWFQNPNASVSHVIRFYSGSDYCKLSNCAITGYGLSENTSSESKWISIYGTNNTLENCTIADKKNIGCAVVVWYEDSSHVPTHTIKNCYFEREHTIYDNADATTGAANSQELIRIGNSDYFKSSGKCTIEGNHFYHCHGELAECVSDKTCNNTIKGNLFEDSKSSLVLRHGNGCTVEGNYLIGNEDSNGDVMSDLGGIRVIAEDHIVKNNYLKNITGSKYFSAITLSRGEVSPENSGYYPMKNVTVSDNTLVNCNYSFNVNYTMKEDHTVDISSTTISDNTVYCSSSDYYHAYAEDSYLDADGLTWSGNQFIGTSGLFSAFATESTALFTPVSGSEPAYPAAAIQTIRNQAGCSWDVE